MHGRMPTPRRRRARYPAVRTIGACGIRRGWPALDPAMGTAGAGGGRGMRRRPAHVGPPQVHLSPVSWRRTTVTLSTASSRSRAAEDRLARLEVVGTARREQVVAAAADGGDAAEAHLAAGAKVMVVEAFLPGPDGGRTSASSAQSDLEGLKDVVTSSVRVDYSRFCQTSTLGVIHDGLSSTNKGSS